MKYVYLLLILLPNLMAAQVNDTAKILPSAEITAVRLSRYAVGQQQISIDSAALKTFQFQNIGDVLQNLTPLSIKAYGSGLSTATSRGTGSRHTALVWNGLNIQNGLIGLSDLSALEVGAVDKMYVKFGGSSALFGSGAIGGAIFIDNTLENTTGFHGNVGFNAGSFGLFGENIKLKLGNENIAGQVRISHQKALNNFAFRNVADVGKPIKHAENAAFKKSNLTNSLFFNLGKNRFLKINSWLSSIYREIPPTMAARVDSAKQKEQAFRSVAEFSTPLSISTKNTILKARLGYFDEKLNYESDIVKNSQNGIKTLISELETVTNFTEKSTLRLGLNYTKNKTAANNLGDMNHERHRFALFASQNFEFKKTKFAANIRQEIVDNQLVPFVFSLGFERAISYQPSAISLRGSFSRNYNLPALNDLYWNILGNPKLVAERGFSGELGIDFLIKNPQSATSLGFTGFALQTNNWIQWSPQSGSSWTPTNLKTVFSRGVELVVKHQFNINKLSLKTHFNYQLSRATEGGDVDKLQLIYTPIHAGSMGFSGNFKQFYVNYYQNASSKRRMADGFTNPFTVGNMTIGYTFLVHKYQLNAALNVSNIWNTDYQVIKFYAQPRRHFEAQFNLIF
jgi:vitamin B12 transporter